MSATPVSTITVGARHRRDMGDLSTLAKSIEEIGLLHPIVIDKRSVLIAGERRLRACSEVLGWREVPVTVVDPVVYPACADRIGMLGRRLAEGVAGFYGNYEHLQFLGGVIFNDPRQAPSSPELARYAIAFEQACLNALPLFEELPIKGMREPLDLPDLKAKVQGMAKARAAQEDAPAA